MKAVITVIGQDKIGIIYNVTSVLAEYDVNILDINQTIMQEVFTMIMVVDLAKMPVSFEELQKKLAQRRAKKSAFPSGSSTKASSML